MKRTSLTLMVLVLITASLMVMGVYVGSTGWAIPVDQLLWDIRLPRSLGAWLAGALLGLSGAIAQGLFRNPLADPYLLGSAAGSTLAVSFMLIFFGAGGGWWLSLGLTGAAFIGAMAAVLLTLTLARGVQNTLQLLLAGVIVGVVAGAANSLLTTFHPETLQTMQAFMLGSTAFVDMRACLLMALALAVCLTIGLLFSRFLDGLALGEETAQSLGLSVPLFRMGLIGVLALATGAVVAQTGLIAFVGLAAPHIIRATIRIKHAGLMALSSIVGGCLLLAADILARGLIAPQELPVGVLTAVLGGGYLLFRMYRWKRS